jgi:predicted DNA-binding protein (UPF0251 family)
MTRPKCCRKIASLPGIRRFAPENCENDDGMVSLSLDEIEAIRLADYEGLYQEEASERMGVSRQTFGRIIQTARGKVAEALLDGRVLEIRGGTVEIEKTGSFICGRCNGHFESVCPKRGKRGCPECGKNGNGGIK